MSQCMLRIDNLWVRYFFTVSLH